MSEFVGTSGYSYKEWKGIFYPQELAAKKMLSFYATHFNTVEINNTFYRMPAASTFEQWRSEVPEGFVFAVKAPQRITHQKRLVGTEDDVRYLTETASVLGPALGPLLFQLPPFAKKDLPKLRDLLQSVDRRYRVAMEFRNATWEDDEVLTLLSDHDAAWCHGDTDEKPVTQLHGGTTWGYVRLRRLEYTDAELATWRERIGAMGWQDQFTFFKHEDEARGPRFATRFLEIGPQTRT